MNISTGSWELWENAKFARSSRILGSKLRQLRRTRKNQEKKAAKDQSTNLRPVAEIQIRMKLTDFNGKIRNRGTAIREKLSKFTEKNKINERISSNWWNNDSIRIKIWQRWVGSAPSRLWIRQGAGSQSRRALKNKLKILNSFGPTLVRFRTGESKRILELKSLLVEIFRRNKIKNKAYSSDQIMRKLQKFDYSKRERKRSQGLKN